MTKMTDMAGRPRRYTYFITVKTRNFYVPPGILKFRVYALSGDIRIFGYMDFSGIWISGICTFGFMLPYQRNECETRGEPVVGVAFEQEWGEVTLLVAALLPERTVVVLILDVSLSVHASTI